MFSKIILWATGTVLTVLSLSFFLPRNAEAQFFVNDTFSFTTPNTTCYVGVCNDKQQHALGQAFVGVVVSTPILPRSWRNTFLKRIAIGTGVSVAVEFYDIAKYGSMGMLNQPGHGFSYRDVMAGVAGQLAIEGIRYGAPRIVRVVKKLF